MEWGWVQQTGGKASTKTPAVRAGNIRPSAACVKFISNFLDSGQLNNSHVLRARMGACTYNMRAGICYICSI